MYKYLLFIIIIMQNIPLYAISMVYNFRMAEITKQPIFHEPNDISDTIVALLFEEYKKKYNKIHTNYTGGLGSVIRTVKSYYFRTDFAGTYISEKFHHKTIFKGSQADDILFTVGKSFIFAHHSMITLSGLLGIPTHRNLILQHIDFGFGQIGIGIQIDGAYGSNHKKGLLYGFRYVYFIPRDIFDEDNQRYRFTVGHITDILLAYQYRWQKNHEIESGYTVETRIGADIHPYVNYAVRRINYITSNFYFVYKYKFLIKNIANRLFFNFAYGFDNKPNRFSDKHIVTMWLSWNTTF